MNTDKPERLSAHHDTSTFDAGPTDTLGQGGWLRDHGLTNDARGITRVFVACYAGTLRVGAFFGLSSGTITRDSLPKPFRPHGTPMAIPVTLIARLAVDEPLQANKLGRGLLLEALDHAAQAHEHVGSALIIVDAAGEKAQRLYGHYGFKAIEDAKARTTRMVLPVATAIQLLRGM